MVDPMTPPPAATGYGDEEVELEEEDDEYGDDDFEVEDLRSESGAASDAAPPPADTLRPLEDSPPPGAKVAQGAHATAQSDALGLGLEQSDALPEPQADGDDDLLGAMQPADDAGADLLGAMPSQEAAGADPFADMFAEVSLEPSEAAAAGLDDSDDAIAAAMLAEAAEADRLEMEATEGDGNDSNANGDDGEGDGGVEELAPGAAFTGWGDIGLKGDSASDTTSLQVQGSSVRGEDAGALEDFASDRPTDGASDAGMGEGGLAPMEEGGELREEPDEEAVGAVEAPRGDVNGAADGT
eukprot:jgi/Tetstr1/444842/TSEL_032684.t1